MVFWHSLGRNDYRKAMRSHKLQRLLSGIIPLPSRKRICLKSRISNFVFLHTGRCGSTVLNGLLDQHPEIVCDGEVFFEYCNSNSPVDPMHFLENRVYSSRCNYYSFMTKCLKVQDLNTHKVNMDIKEYIDRLLGLGFDHFISVRRNNYLARCVSQKVGSKTKIWHAKHSPRRPTRVNVDVNNFSIHKSTMPLLQFFYELDEHYARLNSILGNYRHLNLAYEDDILPNPLIAYEKVCSFVGIRKCPAKVRFQRTNPFKLRNVIENFEEIGATLKNTKYEWMLAE